MKLFRTLSMLWILAAFLESLPRERFNYGRWTSQDWRENKCGTTACAGGWATTLSIFKNEGLSLNSRGVPVATDRHGVQLTCEDALAEVLNISSAEARYLFIPDWSWPGRDEDLPFLSPAWDATPQEVANHIYTYIIWRSKQ